MFYIKNTHTKNYLITQTYTITHTEKWNSEITSMTIFSVTSIIFYYSQSLHKHCSHTFFICDTHIFFLHLAQKFLVFTSFLLGQSVHLARPGVTSVLSLALGSSILAIFLALPCSCLGSLVSDSLVIICGLTRLIPTSQSYNSINLDCELFLMSMTCPLIPAISINW